jgi:hypothetical protein
VLSAFSALGIEEPVHLKFTLGQKSILPGGSAAVSLPCSCRQYMLLQEWAADLKRDKVRYDTAVAQRVCTAAIVTAMARKRRVMSDIVGVMNLWSALRPRPIQAVGSTDALRNSSIAEVLQDDADVAEVFTLEQMEALILDSVLPAGGSTVTELQQRAEGRQIGRRYEHATDNLQRCREEERTLPKEISRVSKWQIYMERGCNSAWDICDGAQVLADLQSCASTSIRRYVSPAECASKLAISQALRKPGAGTVPYLRQHLVALKRMREELDKAGSMQPAQVAQAAARPAVEGTADSAAAGVSGGGDT